MDADILDAYKSLRDRIEDADWERIPPDARTEMIEAELRILLGAQGPLEKAHRSAADELLLTYLRQQLAR